MMIFYGKAMRKLCALNNSFWRLRMFLSDKHNKKKEKKDTYKYIKNYIQLLWKIRSCGKIVLDE